MEGKSDKATGKKFSFRKRRSSKGKKEADSPPVDQQTEQEAAELVSQDPEPTPEKQSIDVQTPVGTTEQDKTAQQSSGEDPSLKTGDSPPSEGSRKKKSKRRSLFKRNSKKSSVKKSDDGCELKTKGDSCEKGDEGSAEASEATFVDVDLSVDQEQVVCEEQERQGEITDQSDGEGYLSMGEASEAEGETLVEGKDSPPGESTEAAGEVDKGTKRKGFFKRGLSLKRRKSKKQQTNETKEEAATTEHPCEAEVQTESTPVQIEEINQPEAVKETNEDINNEIKTDEPATLSVIAKKYPTKPPRKVSFIGPDGTKLGSSDDGDSQGDESEADTITSEDGPSETEVVEAEVDSPEVVTPEVVVMSEDPGSNSDDDFTDVTSMSSSLLASSSDAPDTLSASDGSRLYVLTDTDDNGSRITLEGISEESEFESKPKVVSEESGTETKPEVANEEPETKTKPEVVGGLTEFESRPEKESENEATKLLGDGDVRKVGENEWEMVNMSVELQRVRKQTLFSVKRLCCSVM